MNGITRRSSLLLLAALSSHAGAAPTLSILTAGAFRQVVLALAPSFEKRTGITLKIDGDTAGALARRVQAGEAFDLLFAPPAALAALPPGAVDPASVRPLARVGIGLAVKAGAAHPPLETAAQFKAALLAAGKVAYVDPAAGGTSGIYLEQLFERLGIAEAMRPRAVKVKGGLAAERVAAGEADIAVQQISELMTTPGVELAGPLPAELQSYTVYAGAIAARSGQAAAAQAFLDALAGAAELIASKGMSLP
ncbi:substrate-binding domain-containing protein [Pelomonas sp. KK5]|uniref:substrate-binding domain-containing protein n=1 Tax=Pelomonas sp. KK5 TaxID=1855730 RepID=UPI0009FA2EFB|nr:substrate-binding domain-containing protein [Pelomonas sp. KK5]